MIDTSNPADSGARMASQVAVPVIRTHQAQLGAGEYRRLDGIAEKLLRNEPALASTSHFGEKVSCGLDAHAPCLLIADQSEISLFGTPEESLLEYRLAALARSDDMLVLSHDRSPAFENYLSDCLGISSIDVLKASSGPAEHHWPLPKRCYRRPELLQHIVHKARATGNLNILPYLSTGHTWNLGQRISEQADCEISVTAPPPRLALRVNDKTWFANCVRQVLGRQALSPSVTAYGPTALARHVLRMAKQSRQLVIKVPDSAGSSGNLTLDAGQFTGQRGSVVRRQLLSMLRDIGWQGAFPLKIEEWEEQILSSPSVQIWIPHRRDGPPVIEGLFEQVIEGEAGKFAGAIRAQLPAAIQDRLAGQAMALAYVFQQLGYFGRCSIDALIVGSACDVHWVECNGRWGGVSVPMSLLNRVLEDPRDWQVMIVQKLNLQLKPRPFLDTIEAVKDMLFRTDRPNDGIVLLSPNCYELGAGVHFMALARNLDRARALSRDTMQRLAVPAGG